MNIRLSSLRSIAVALVVSAMTIGQSVAAFHSPGPSFRSPLQNVQADCYAIGQQVAAQNGGQLARASAANRGGQQVCVIVVLVPGRDGQRPRRAEFVVPAN